MCFSAEAWTLFDAYVREFGAGIDIEEFWKLYLARDEAYRVRNKMSDGHKVPKGMDLNFLHPKSEKEQAILDLIEEWNARKVSESELELFKQVKRLADAERKLAVKETQKALTDQRVATNKIVQLKRWIADAKRTKLEEARDNRIFPDWYAPVLLVENGKKIVRPMRYHCRPCGMDSSTDRTKTGQVSGKYNARRDNLEKFWRKQFGLTHCLMLAETFYENVDDGHMGSKEIQFSSSEGVRSSCRLASDNMVSSWMISSTSADFRRAVQYLISLLITARSYVSCRKAPPGRKSLGQYSGTPSTTVAAIGYCWLSTLPGTVGPTERLADF